MTLIECQKKKNMKFIRIKNLREQHNYTQIQVANHIGVTKRTYLNYENGKTKTPLRILIELSYFYDTSVDYLIGFTRTPIPHKRNHTK